MSIEPFAPEPVCVFCGSLLVLDMRDGGWWVDHRLRVVNRFCSSRAGAQAHQIAAPPASDTAGGVRSA